MKTTNKIIQELNRMLASELVAINQFFLHARMFKNWGFEALNDVAYKQSIKAMKDADDLIERILFLEGLPNLQKLNRLNIGEDTQEMLQSDLDFRIKSRADLQKAIVLMESSNDYLSRELLSEIMEHCEEYIDWLETQLDLMKKTGVQNYLQSQMSDSD